jgi:DNA polymerase-3 subunit epsilon
MSGREIILDLETTGLYPKRGDRVIEIGAVEVVDKIKTGKFFHQFVKPDINVSHGAFSVHGISNDFLRDKPRFCDIVEDFLLFIGKDKLVIHNAPFDMKFINNELSLLQIELIEYERAIDTLMMARRKFPGSPASLDALCKRFNVSLQQRLEKGHGALLDSELLYQVYICLTEGVQSELILKKAEGLTKFGINLDTKKTFTEPRRFEANSEDQALHREFLKTISNSIWEKV